MGVLPTAGPLAVPVIFSRMSAAASGSPAAPGNSPPDAPVQQAATATPLQTAAPQGSQDGWRDRELVGEYFAFIGDRLKARHQKNRKLEFTVDGFRRTEWSEAAERAFETGRPPPPTLDLSAAELLHLAGVRGYKDRCNFYTAKLGRVLAAVQELLAENSPPIQPEVVAWR